MKLNTFSITKLMIHNVPRGNDPAEELILTDDPIILDTELKRYFQNKIINSLSMRGIEVVPDINEDETVRKAVALIIANPSELASSSRDIAERLYQVQSGKNPAGLLAIASGTIEGNSCTSVLKLEREQGLRFKINTDNDRRVVDLEYLRDLTLTDKTKVFKTSLFVVDRNSGASAMSISGRVSDDQGSGDSTTQVANFFLSTFLGCRLRDNPEKTTLAFVEAAYSFINKDVTDPEQRGNYQIALLAMIQDQSTEVHSREFGNNHLNSIDRPIFLDRIKEAGIDPDVPFSKDNRLVKARGFKMTFESGMVLVGKREDLEERVNIRSVGSTTQGVDIDDAIKSLNGR